MCFVKEACRGTTGMCYVMVACRGGGGTVTCFFKD